MDQNPTIDDLKKELATLADEYMLAEYEISKQPKRLERIEELKKIIHTHPETKKKNSMVM